MKTSKWALFALSIILFSCSQPTSEDASGPESEEESYFKNGIQWRGENETANWLTQEGVAHWSNIEFDKAFVLWDHAVQVDSTLFAPHVMLAMMSDGEKREWHIKMAKKYVQDKNETSKKFVTLLDLEDSESPQEDWAAIWAEMHEMSNGPWIHLNYARTLATPDDVSATIEELDNVIAVCKEQGVEDLLAAATNMKAYMLQQAGDLEGGIAAAEEYTKLWAGHNSKDTRAEFYLFAGDTTNAIKWYEATVDMYPWATAARDHLEELKPEEESEE